MRHFEPAQLFPVRAVGQHVLQVAGHGTIDHGVDFVQQRVAAGERADPRSATADKIRPDIDQLRQLTGTLDVISPCGAADVEVLESEIGEARRKELRFGISL